MDFNISSDEDLDAFKNDPDFSKLGLFLSQSMKSALEVKRILKPGQDVRGRLTK